MGFSDYFRYTAFAWKLAGGGRCARFHGRLAALDEDEEEETCCEGTFILYNGMQLAA